MKWFVDSITGLRKYFRLEIIYSGYKMESVTTRFTRNMRLPISVLMVTT